MTQTFDHTLDDQTAASQTGDATTAVDRYLTALNEPDAATRRRLLEQAFDPAGGMTDPPLTGQGHEGIAALGDALHSAYAGHAFRRTSEVDSHHDRFRFAWELVGPAGVAYDRPRHRRARPATAASARSSASSATSPRAPTAAGPRRRPRRP